MSGAVAQQADAADEPHGGWKVSKVSYLHLKSGSQLIRGVRLSLQRGADVLSAAGFGFLPGFLATQRPDGHD